MIAKSENLQIEKATLEKLIDISGGDMRKSVNLLQSASTLFDKVITDESITQISGIVPQFQIEAMID